VFTYYPRRGVSNDDCQRLTTGNRQRVVAVTLGKPSVPYTTSASVLIKQRNSNATVNQPIDTPNPSFHAFLFCFNKIKSLLLPKHLLVVGPASVASVSTLVLWCVGRVDREPLRSSSVVTMRLSCTGMALDLRHCRDPTFTGRGHCWDCLSIPGTLTLTLDCVVDYERGLTTDFRVGTQIGRTLCDDRDQFSEEKVS